MSRVGGRSVCAECGGAVPNRFAGLASHCPQCARPVGFCRECESAFQALAIFCGRCGQPVQFRDSDAAARDPQAIREAFRPDHRPQIKLLDQHFECAATIWRGFVWALSANGEVLRVNPASGEVSTLVELGAEFGKSPMCLVYSPWIRGAQAPLVLAVSGREIVGWNAAAGEPPTRLAAAGVGEHFLASMSDDGYVGVTAEGGRAFALLRAGRDVSLFSSGMRPGDEWRASACAATAAGPLLVDGRVCCYSESAIYYLEDDRLKSCDLPTGVSLIVSPQETRGYRPPGEFPWVLAAAGAYLPASSDGRFGFVWFRFEAHAPARQFVPVDHDCSYSRTADGRLLVCRSGQLLLAENGGVAPHHIDPQIFPSGLEFFGSGLNVYAASAAAGTVLRAHHPAFEQDFAMPRARGDAAPSRFAAVGDCFVLPFFDQTQRLLDIGVAIWRL